MFRLPLSSWFIAVLIAFGPVSSAFAAPKWFTDLDEAKAVAAKENKPLLVNFTVSDTSGPGFMHHAKLFDKPEFEEFAKGYVLVEIDFSDKKPQSLEEKTRNRAAHAKLGSPGFPSVLLLDAKTGVAYGYQDGYWSGLGPKAYLEKLSAFKNTEEGRALVEARLKKQAEADKPYVFKAKLSAAIERKDFAAACAAYDEMFGEVSGRSRAILNLEKAAVSMRIDVKDTARALKFVDAALVDAASDEAFVATIKTLRAMIAAGENPFAVKAVAPKAEGKPAVEAKKVEKGA